MIIDGAQAHPAMENATKALGGVSVPKHLPRLGQDYSARRPQGA